MSLKILNQINEFKNNRSKYSEAEKRLLIVSFREELRKQEQEEQKEKGTAGEDSLIFI